MNEMTATEMQRLADWLQANGMTAAQVLECLAYIAGAQRPHKA